ncbi:MAG: hypothetical protein WKG07_11200 [Hymenobacter sp.]
MLAYDAALAAGQARFRTAEFWRVGAPKDSVAAMAVSAPSILPLRHNGLDTLFVDRATGAAAGPAFVQPSNGGRATASASLSRCTPAKLGAFGLNRWRWW